MKLLAIITARANSTRLPGKNLKKIKNKSLVEITIDFIKKIEHIDDILITSDSKKINDIAKKKNIKIVDKRPIGLSSIKTSSALTVIHAVKWYEKHYKNIIDAIVLFQPTTPFRNKIFIKKCIEKFFLLKKTVASCNICFKRGNLNLSDGSIYIINKKELFRLRSFNEKNAYKIYSKNITNSIDIDNFEDLSKARRLANVIYE
jgi:CMP-N-acetylneuraminic acid synthetase